MGRKWKYRDIVEGASAELKEVLFIVTQGNPTGIPIKEEEEDYESIKIESQ